MLRLQIDKALRQLQTEDSGGIAIVTALSATILIGFVAAGVDFNRAVAVQNDVRHVTRAICARTASALNRGETIETAKTLSVGLGNELIKQTTLESTKAAFAVTIDQTTQAATVNGKAVMATAFMPVFNITSLSPTDTLACSYSAPASSTSSTPPAGTNCANTPAGSAINPQMGNLAGGSGANSGGFNSTTAGNYGSQSNSSGSAPQSNANSSGGFGGGTGSTSGGTAASGLGSGSLSCSTVTNGNSSATSFGGGYGSGPGATSQASSNSQVTSNSAASSGGGAGFSGPGGGPAGGGGGGSAGVFCVGNGC